MSIIYGYKQLNANVVITNEVGSAQDVLAVVKQNASAKVINLTSVSEAELALVV